MKEKILLRRRFFGKHKDRRIVVDCNLHQLGDQRPYFSCTVEYGDGAGGCDHEAALAVWPDCKIICDMHLSDDSGAPMHAEANGWYQLAGALGGMGEQYHAGNSERQHWKPGGVFDGYRISTPDECLQTFAEHCRISLDEARAIAEEVKTADDPRAKWGEIMGRFSQKWENQVAEAKAFLAMPDVRDESYVSPENDASTLAGFIKKHGINCRCEEVGENPHAPDWTDATHWRCLLTMGRSRLTVYFSKGSGHEGAEPTAKEVLRCVLDDSRSADESFDDWAANYGYDTDSRKAEKIYKTVTTQAGKLRKFLGSRFDAALTISE